jgi:hypothetical protein
MLVTKRSLKKKSSLQILFISKKKQKNKQRRKGSIISGSNIDNLSVDVIKFEQHELTKMQYNALDILFFKEKMAPNIFLIFRKLRRKESILSGYNIDNLSVDVIKRLQ